MSDIIRGNTYVVVELKKTQKTDQVVGQILRYMGWAREAYTENSVRGIIIVGRKDDALRYALKATSGFEAKEFKLSLR
jgi:RecB family endonuclease NucS